MFSRNKTGQEGNNGTVGPSEAGTCDLPVQHGQLVAQNEDLGVLGRGIHPMDAKDLNDAPDETLEKGQGHDQQASPSLLWLIKLGQAVSGPFRPSTTTAVLLSRGHPTATGAKSIDLAFELDSFPLLDHRELVHLAAGA